LQNCNQKYSDKRCSKYFQAAVGGYFTIWVKTRFRKKEPSITLPQLRVLLDVALPLRRYDVDTPIELAVYNDQDCEF